MCLLFSLCTGTLSLSPVPNLRTAETLKCEIVIAGVRDGPLVPSSARAGRRQGLCALSIHFPLGGGVYPGDDQVQRLRLRQPNRGTSLLLLLSLLLMLAFLLVHVACFCCPFSFGFLKQNKCWLLVPAISLKLASK